MSDLPRITPTSGVTIPPIRPTRESSREPRKSRREKKRERDEDETPESVGPTEDEPGKSGSINLRV